MAKVIASNDGRFQAVFSEREFSKYNPIRAQVVKYQKRVFVNWSLPLMTWDGHDVRCVEDILDMLKKIGNWQGRLQDKQPLFGGHAHKPTILRDNGLHDQKVRFPVFAKQSAPYVQWVRNDDEGSRWLVHGFSFNDDIPSIGAYFAAITKLKTEFIKINKNL